MLAAEIETEPKVGFKTLPLDDALVAAHLDNKLAEHDCIMLATHSRWSRSHLKLHHDRKGYFVRVGSRGGCKQYLGRCKIVYLDGKPTLFQFTLAETDAFDAKQTRLFNERHGITE